LGRQAIVAGGSGSVYPTNDAVLEHGDVEVDQQTDRFAGEFEVGDNLCVVNRMQFFDALQFDDDRILGEHVDAETAIQSDGFVDYRQFDLAREGYIPNEG